MELIKAKTKFKKTTDQEIDLALADPNPNEIGQEIARLIDGYTKNLVQFIHEKGHIPESILRKKGSCPIEERAIQLVLNEFKNEGQGMSDIRKVKITDNFTTSMTDSEIIDYVSKNYNLPVRQLEYLEDYLSTHYDGDLSGSYRLMDFEIDTWVNELEYTLAKDGMSILQGYESKVCVAYVYKRLHEALDDDNLAGDISRLMDEMAHNFEVDTKTKIGVALGWNKNEKEGKK